MDFDDPTILDCGGFRRVAEQPEHEQRALLRSKEPRARVWAAWSLGQRLSQDFCEEARALIADEPVPGVRRHLLVMLAGFGEVDIVAALARHDPNVYVRSTAARFVGELSVRHPDALAIAAQLLEDPADVIRAAVIAGLPLQLPRALELQLRRAHDDDSPLVRDALTRRASIEQDYQSLRRNAFGDADIGVRWLALRKLIDAVGVHGALASLNQEQLHGAISDLHTMEVRVAFDDIAALLPDRDFLPILDFTELGTEGRIWLLTLPGHPVRDYWRLVMSAYTDVDLVDAAEARAVGEFVVRLEQSLMGSDPTDEVGALAPWGDWSRLDSDRYQLVTLLRDKLMSRAD